MARRPEETDYGFPPARGGRGAPSMFPRKLYQILCETDPAVVGWDNDGESFHIADMELFVESVMPMYYRHNKLTSFQRQLNLYGFKKRGRDEKHAGHYYHPFFQRDHPEILGDVRRSYPTGSGNSKSEDDEAGSSTTSSTPHARATYSRELSSSPGRPRTDSSPKRKAETPLPANSNKKAPPPQQQQQRQQRIRNTVGGAEARRENGGGRYVQHSYPYRPEYSGEQAREICREARGAPKKSPQRPWFYSGSPAVSEAVIAARYKRPEDHRNVNTATDGSFLHGEEGWMSNGRGGAGGMGGGIGRAGFMRTNTRPDLLGRHPYPYSAPNGRVWGPYREQEESGGAMWHDSEETGPSRMVSSDSACSPWGEMHPSVGGADSFERSRARAMVETDVRRSSYPPNSSGGGGVGGVGGGLGRPLGAHPLHRGVQTPAMFPAHFVRNERFGAFSDPHYPPPPVFLPAHTTPDPDVPPPRKSSKWRPVYDGSRLNVGGDGGEDGVAGSSSWSDPSRYARGVRMPGGRDGRKGSTAFSAMHERAREGVGAGDAPRLQPGHGIQSSSGSASSTYRAACEDFLRGEEVSESARPNGFRFGPPDAHVASASPTVKGDAVSSRSIAMAATT